MNILSYIKGHKVITAVVAASLVVTTGGVSYAMVNNESQQVIQAVKPSKSVEPTQETKPEPSASPVTQATVTPAPEVSTKPTPEPIETPKADPMETLIAQYGWSASPNRDAINHIMSRFPHKFTPEKRDASFAYINNVATASGGITYISVYLSSVQGIPTEDNLGSQMAWDRLAKRVGL